MDIRDRNDYYNSIYQAVVVNTDTSQDPANCGRIQIYIPSLFYNYSQIYQTYMADTNKSANPDKDKFPWAVTLIEDLSIGDIVYGGFIDNTNGNYIIIGKCNAITSTTSFSALESTFNASELLDLACAVILYNEVSLPISAWPDNITDTAYGKVRPDDNGAISIGIIQWHGSGAYDLLYQIAKRDGNWDKDWSTSNKGLVLNLGEHEVHMYVRKAVSSGGTYDAGNKYFDSLTLKEDTQIIADIQSTLKSDTGKTVQKEIASSRILKSIENLQNTYGITNPAMLIYIADFANQYGETGDSYETINMKNEAKRIQNAGGGNFISQLDELDKWAQKNVPSYYTYEGRRTYTLNYIKNLYNTGKLFGANLVDLTTANTGGQLLYPVPECKYRTSKFGKRIIDGKENNHTGVDLAGAGAANTNGKPIIAVANGTVTTVVTGHGDKEGRSGGYGNYVKIKHNETMTTLYAHQSKIIVEEGQQVMAGQIIGYVGQTGWSTGYHLHFEVQINGTPVNPEQYIVIPYK